MKTAWRIVWRTTVVFGWALFIVDFWRAYRGTVPFGLLDFAVASLALLSVTLTNIRKWLEE